MAKQSNNSAKRRDWNERTSKTQNSRPSRSNRKENNNQKKRRQGGSVPNSDSIDYSERQGGNDVSWHTPNAQLLHDVGGLQFGYPTGGLLDIYDTTSKIGEYGLNIGNIVVPGLMVHKIMPTVGLSLDPSAPINQAAKSYLSYVRRDKSGTSPYMPADLMFMTIAVSQVYSYINWLQRAYGLLNLYAVENKFIPEMVLDADGINFNDAIQNRATLRYGINTLIYKAAQWYVPSNMKIFQYYAYLYSSIYTEGDSIKDQMYMNSPLGFYWYEEGTGGAAGQLTFELMSKHTAGEHGMTVQELIDYGNMLLDPLVGSEMTNIMAADIKGAFSDDAFLKLSPMPDEIITAPIRDFAFLETFKNATILNTGTLWLDTDGFAITQTVEVGNSFIKCRPQVKGFDTTVTQRQAVEGLILASPRLISTMLRQPDAATVMESTRLMATCTISTADGGTGVALDVECGAAVVAACYLVTRRPDGKSGSIIKAPVRYATTYQNVNYNDIDKYQAITDVASFKYRPATAHFVMDLADASESTGVTGVSFDFDNFGVVHNTELAKLNLVSLWGLFAVPNVMVL